MERDAGLFSVGYGNRPFAAFLDVLELHGVAHVADVRSKPYSRFNPDFSKERLQANLEANGLAYTYLGDVLGGMREGTSSHEELQQNPAFVNGLRRLVALSGKSRVAFMCAELRPEDCHRTRLLGAALGERGIEVRHIDEHGRIITQAEAVRRRTKGQVRLDLDPPEPA